MQKSPFTWMAKVAVPMARKKHKGSLTRSQHRLIGAMASVFLLFMAITGLVINHSHDLGLDRKSVASPALLDWYGLQPRLEIHSFPAGDRWLSHAGSQWFLDGQPLADSAVGIGAVQVDDWLLAAGDDSLLVFDQQGQLIERIPWQAGTLGRIEKLGLSEQGSAALAAGGQTWLSDPDLLEWQPVTGNNVRIAWSEPGNAPPVTLEPIRSYLQGSELSIEQLLLDLHSGRFFGSVGVWIYDLLAIAIASLAISGLVLWWRGRRKGPTNGPKKSRR